MRHIVGIVFAIGVAGVAAIAATTAFLNSPLRIGPATDQHAHRHAPGQTPAPEPPAGLDARAGRREARRPRTPGRRRRTRAQRRRARRRGSRAPKARSPTNATTRIPTKASRPKTCRPICNTTRIRA